jgi:hypothetical protein
MVPLLGVQADCAPQLLPCQSASQPCLPVNAWLSCALGHLPPWLCRCYSAEDCASYLKTCPFSNDTKKGESLGSCGTDKSPFKEGACAPGLEAKIASTDGKAIPLKATVKCFQSEKLTCEIYRNATGHSFITAACKESAKKASGVAHSVLSCCVLLGLLVSGCCCWPCLGMDATSAGSGNGTAQQRA